MANFIMYKSLISLPLVFSLGGCDTGSSIDTAGRGADISTLQLKQPTLTISITDAVIDSAQKVVVQFSGLSIQPENGDTIEYTFDTPRDIDLLSLQGTLFTSLINEQVIPVGTYESIRLHVNASKDDVNDSFIQLDDGSEHELFIPSGSQSGLKINSGFELTETRDLHLMIDFDLRKSVVLSNNGYKLRPTLRLVDMDDVQHISGSIDSALLSADHCSDSIPATGNAVYLFEGYDIVADDIDNQNPNPMTSAAINLNPANGLYEYTFAFMPPGEYTLAFTCQADLDNPETNDGIIFSYSENISVEAATDSPAPAVNPMR
jgi:hypothetical protein